MVGSFTYNSADIKYSTYGDSTRPSIVLIHGFGMDRRIWRDQVRELINAGYYVVTYDMRGFGESSVPHPGYKYNHPDDLVALLDHLKLKEVSIMAHSFGSEVALDLAITKPERVRAMTLISPSLRGLAQTAGSPFPKWREMLIEDKENQVRTEILAEAKKISPGVNDDEWKLIEQILREYSLWHLQNGDTNTVTVEQVGLINDIKTPTRIISGEGEEADQRVAAITIDKALKESELVKVEGVGHFAMLEATDRVTEVTVELFDPKAYVEEQDMEIINAMRARVTHEDEVHSPTGIKKV